MEKGDKTPLSKHQSTSVDVRTCNFVNEFGKITITSSYQYPVAPRGNRSAPKDLEVVACSKYLAGV